MNLNKNRVKPEKVNTAFEDLIQIHTLQKQETRNLEIPIYEQKSRFNHLV